MKNFNKDRLPALTRSVYESHLKWSEKNWKDTLKSHARELNTHLEKISVYDLWKKMLKKEYKDVASSLIPEIFMDSYLSIHYSCMGLYKQANICSRAALETAFRLVYFSTHRVEYDWWCEGNEWYLASGSKDVWGKGYEYFSQLKEIKSFEKELNSKLFVKVRNIYSKLSKFVHSGVATLQTSPERISPKYKLDDFKRWSANLKDVQTLINLILMLGFSDTFKVSGPVSQRAILKAINSQDFKKALRKSLGLRLRGRI